MSDFQSWAAEMCPNLDFADADAVATLRANFEGRATPNDADRAAVMPMILASADSAESERRRLQKIEALCEPPAKGWGDLAPRVATIQAAAIGGEIKLDELKTELRKIRGEAFMQTVPSGHTVYSSGRGIGDANVLTAALCLSAGVQSPEKHFDERTLDAADRHRGIGIQQVLLQAAMQNGYQPMGSFGVSQSNLRQILAFALPQIRATGFSTIDVATIVSNTANKFLREGWDSVDQSILRVALIRSVRDFKQITTVSLTGGLVYEQVGPAGEIKHGTVGERIYTNQANTYAAMLAITRQDIINDDTSALSAAPRKLGRGGMLKLNNLGWTEFLDNSSFFTAGNLNVSTGAGSALGDAGLSAAEKVFLNQTDPDGNPLGIMPAILLVPPTLKSTARKLLNSALLVGSTTANTLLPSGNVWQGAYRLESSPYMEISTYTGNSPAAWYLLADPAQLPVIEIAALNGRVEPTVETAEADFAQLGIQMRGYSDVGVAMQEFRAGVRSAGS